MPPCCISALSDLAMKSQIHAPAANSSARRGWYCPHWFALVARYWISRLLLGCWHTLSPELPKCVGSVMGWCHELVCPALPERGQAALTWVSRGWCGPWDAQCERDPKGLLTLRYRRGHSGGVQSHARFVGQAEMGHWLHLWVQVGHLINRRQVQYR